MNDFALLQVLSWPTCFIALSAFVRFLFGGGGWGGVGYSSRRMGAISREKPNPLFDPPFSLHPKTWACPESWYQQWALWAVTEISSLTLDCQASVGNIWRGLIRPPARLHGTDGQKWRNYIRGHFMNPILHAWVIFLSALSTSVATQSTRKILPTRSLGALRAPTSSWRPFGPLDFVLRALRALRPCDPRIGDWIVC